MNQLTSRGSTSKMEESRRLAYRRSSSFQDLSLMIVNRFFYVTCPSHVCIRLPHVSNTVTVTVPSQWRRVLRELYTVALVTSTVDPYYHFFLPVTVSACTVPSYVLPVTVSACTVPAYALLLPSRYPHTHTALRTNVTVITINPESLFLLTLWRAPKPSLLLLYGNFPCSISNYGAPLPSA